MPSVHDAGISHLTSMHRPQGEMFGAGTPGTLARGQQSSRNQTFRKVNGLHCMTQNRLPGVSRRSKHQPHHHAERFRRIQLGGKGRGREPLPMATNVTTAPVSLICSSPSGSGAKLPPETASTFALSRSALLAMDWVPFLVQLRTFTELRTAHSWVLPTLA